MEEDSSLTSLSSGSAVSSFAGTARDSSQEALPKEVKRTHTSSFKRHRASMNIDTDYIISERGKEHLQKYEKIKESDLPPKSTTNTFIFDKLVKAANQKYPAGKIALWNNTLRLQISFMVSYPKVKDLKTLTASEIHSSGLPIIVSDYLKKVRIHHT